MLHVFWPWRSFEQPSSSSWNGGEGDSHVHCSFAAINNSAKQLMCLTHWLSLLTLLYEAAACSALQVSSLKISDE